jgi:hypothetical protein
MLKEVNNGVRFSGYIALGLNNHKDNTDLIIGYPNGGELNNTSVQPHNWPGGNENFRARHYPAGEPEFFTKAELKRMMGISNLVSQEVGHKLYKDTNIGDVLYLTYGTNIINMIETLHTKFIDKMFCVNLK